jgi:uncharacterized protein (DUF1499 family)
MSALLGIKSGATANCQKKTNCGKKQTTIKKQTSQRILGNCKVVIKYNNKVDIF